MPDHVQRLNEFMMKENIELISIIKGKLSVHTVDMAAAQLSVWTRYKRSAGVQTWIRFDSNMIKIHSYLICFWPEILQTPPLGISMSDR